MKAMIPGSEFELGIAARLQRQHGASVVPVAATRAVIPKAILQAAVGEVLPTLGGGGGGPYGGQRNTEQDIEDAIRYRSR